MLVLARSGVAVSLNNGMAGFSLINYVAEQAPLGLVADADSHDVIGILPLFAGARCLDGDIPPEVQVSMDGAEVTS